MYSHKHESNEQDNDLQRISITVIPALMFPRIGKEHYSKVPTII